MEETDVEPGHPLDKRLRSLIIQIAEHAEGAREALHLIVGQADTPAMLTNLLGAHACSDSSLRRAMLECLDVQTRLSMACQHAGRLLLELLEPPEGGGPDTLH